ncbi:hypothetical protein BDR26DRAFT_1008741 [Obelidium mucronatum]|nr:hypothetical protein BDR26DRAFT_1008741 [Obelidium mucronatum]
MSLLPVDSINAITESIGLTLKDSVAQALLADVEYRMREVIFDAKKFMRHSRRTKLTPEDINHALRVRNVQPLYGYTSTAPTKFKSIIHGHSRIYYLDDEEIDLDQIINAPLPPVPLDVAFTAHWLAIEGVQPAIVQNPTPADIRSAATESTNTISKTLADQAAAAAVAATTNSESTGTGTGSSSAIPPVLVSSNPESATVNGETLVKSVLSKELQMYHDKITESIMTVNGPPQIQALAVNSLETDPGIQPLLPYFVQFMTQKITKHIRNLKIMWAMMRMTRALLNNKNLFVEPYLHQMMPNVITCIVSKRISESPMDDHHALRRFAAQLAAHICHTYTSTYPTLQPRVTKTLLRAFLDPLKSNATHYGAITGLADLGNQVVKMLIRPNVKAFMQDCLTAGLNSTVEHEKKDAGLVLELIIDVLHKHVLVEYDETEKAVLKETPTSFKRPTLNELETEFVDSFGELVGKRVAALLDASLTERYGSAAAAAGSNEFVSFTGSEELFGMDVDM